MNNIAGIINKNKNILGLMPHPERAVNFQKIMTVFLSLEDCKICYDKN